jgi:2-polyprenyl-3-methyl-5-hydroxy-6-metoxy-1,4-benzoquinol methylase
MREPAVEYQGRVKYDERLARGYQNRPPGKHAAEMRLIARAFELIPKPARVLDAPCGGGRVALSLAAEGHQVTAADLSPAMLKIAQENVAQSAYPIAVEHADVEKLAYADRAFDAVICFRLFHHFPDPKIRARVVGELCRVAKRYVALSYFSPASYTSLKRKLRAKLTGKKTDRYATSLAEVKSYFAPHQFRLIHDFAQLPLLHTLHLALFERVEPGLQRMTPG